MPTVEEVLRTGPVLSEASIFERLRRTPGIEFDPEVGIGALVTDSRWQPALWEIHRGYLEIGLDAGLPVLLQTYRRDTGEIMHDISVPIQVNGRHWGGFRIGYRTE